MKLWPFLLLAGPALAQSPRGLPVPIGARVKIEGATDAQSVEGTVLAWRQDTLLVLGKERPDTVHVAASALKKLRVVESPALWRYTSPSNINFFRTVEIPRAYDRTSASGDAFESVLILGNKTELVGINPATGTVTWSRKDLADLKQAAMDIVGSTGFGLITLGDTMQTIDLRSGQKRWDSATLSFAGVRGWLPSPNADTAIIILGRTARSAWTLVAVDVATGKVRWRQDSAFTVEPKSFSTKGVSYLFGNQLPFADTDSSLVLYLSTDGPVRLDARSGAVLWRSTALKAAKLPLRSDAYASIVQRRGVLFVPSGDSLLALRSSDGGMVWSTPRFKDKVLRTMPTSRGLVVRGDEWFTLLDPENGHALWHATLALKNTTWDVLRGDTDYVVSDKRVVAIDIRDGSVRTIAEVDFKERERPGGITVWKEGIILNSWHNLLLVDRKGTVRYQHEYPSPKSSFGELINPMVSDIMRPTTRWVGSRIFFYTSLADPQGHEGFCVVEVDPTDGHEAARLWFNGRVPTYLLDGPTAAAYYRRDDQTVDALPLLDGGDLDHASRNGLSSVVERLLGMGLSAAAPRSDGWTPLHLAAYGGHADVVRLLLGHGAKADATTPQGWTPWTLALRERHDSLAQALRGNADTNSAGAAAANALRMARQGRIPDALAQVSLGVARDSSLGLWPSVWRGVCWQGSLAGQAGAVLQVCDRAVDRTPPDDSDYDSALLSRAIARALSGNLAGAATDLETSGASADDNGSWGRWIAALRQGRNPFTPAVLDAMQR